MSRIAGIQRHDDSQPRDSELEPHPKRQTETGPATYMVIERNTAFDLTHGRSRPANEFTSAMVRTLGPAPGQTHFYDCPIDNVQDRGLANALALREFKRYLETYPDCTHHSGRRQNGTYWYVLVLQDGSARCEIEVIRRLGTNPALVQLP